MTADAILNQQIKGHYNTFITEQAIGKIAGAGLNWIHQISLTYPVLGYQDMSWRAFPGESQLAACTHIAIWTVLSPTCQSYRTGKWRIGSINFMYGVMGISDAQQTLDYIWIVKGINITARMDQCCAWKDTCRYNTLGIHQCKVYLLRIVQWAITISYLSKEDMMMQRHFRSGYY